MWARWALYSPSLKFYKPLKKTDLTKDVPTCLADELSHPVWPRRAGRRPAGGVGWILSR